MRSKNVILYHKNCFDGFSAAWSAWRKFGKRAEYVGVKHQTPPPDGLDGKNIFILDFCYPPDVMKKLVGRAARVIVLDHHKSAEAAVKMAGEHMYDNSHSGAVLGWLYFHPKKKVPKLLLYVEDNDLWKFKLPRSREVYAAISEHKMDFGAWSKLAAKLENPASKKRLLADGRAVLNFQAGIIEHAVSGAELVSFHRKKVYAANSATLVSEIGNALCEKKGPMAIVWSKRSRRISVSLRSVGDFDVSKIALRHGGGGHKNASGFMFPAENAFPWKSAKK